MEQQHNSDQRTNLEMRSDPVPYPNYMVPIPIDPDGTLLHQLACYGLMQSNLHEYRKGHPELNSLLKAMETGDWSDATEHVITAALSVRGS